MSKNVMKAPAQKKASPFSRPGSQKIIVFLVVIALFAFFSILSPNFRKYTTVLSIMDYSYYIALMAIGVTFPLITGGVDLSIGTGLICYSLAGGYLIVHCGWPTWAGMLVAILFGVAIGTLNGVLVSIMNLPPFRIHLCKSVWNLLAYRRCGGKLVSEHFQGDHRGYQISVRVFVGHFAGDHHGVCA